MYGYILTERNKWIITELPKEIFEYCHYDIKRKPVALLG